MRERGAGDGGVRGRRPAWRPARLAAAAVLGLGCLGAPAARAEGVLERRFGSDAANRENLGVIADLLGKGSHLDLRVGAWFANLSRGPFAALGSSDAFEGKVPPDLDFETPEKAGKRIGRGRGVLREVGIELGVAGNEAFFDYVSDKLLSAAQDEVNSRVSNETLRETIQIIAGELRPNLTSLLGPHARPWLTATYGRFEGTIDDAHFFRSRDGKPFFGGRSSPWETKFFSAEGGVFYESGKPGKGETVFRTGVYARYLSFQMPVVVGFLSENLNDASLALQQGDFRAIGVGFRGDVAGCTSVVCLNLSGSIIPMTGYGRLDLGPWGEVPGLPMMMSIDPGLSVPIKIGQAGVLRPYASFRVDWLGLANMGSTGGDAGYETEPAVPDYLLWGPRAGLALEL